MIKANALPALFTASTWKSPDRFTHDGVDKLLASIDGSWTTTLAPDGVRIAEADFDAIAGATPNASGTLQIAGVERVVSARMTNGERWVFLDYPEE